jgi:hypothetical protein
MKRLAVGSLAMIGAMMIAPLSAQAGGRCPLDWLRHRHVHAAPAPVKAAPAKKAAKPMKVAAKPMK